MIIFLNSFKSFGSFRLNLPSPLVYSEEVTSVDTVTEVGSLERLVSSPSHIADYDFGESGDLGLYEITSSALDGGPQLLYPGEIAISQPNPGGEVSVTHDPWIVGVGALTTGYRLMVGSTQKASIFPYDNTSDTPGEIYEFFVDATDNNGTRTFKLWEYVLQENPLGPVLSNFSVNYDTNTVSFNSDIACTVTWRRYPLNYTFTNKASEVLAGTGAMDGGSYNIESGENSDSITFTGGITGDQELWIVGRVGSGPISDPIGGVVNITPDGSSLASPAFRGSSFGGSGTDVSSVQVQLPAYENEDLVILPIGIDYPASGIAGVTATGPNGEVATIKQALTDNGVSGTGAISLALLYYRATAANVSGSVTINITPGGAKNADHILCTPIVRYNVKASGDPFAQVVKTSSSTAVSSGSTSVLTAVSAASRIEAAILSDATAPSGVAPSGWFMRESGLLGSQAIQTMSRNAAVTAASESISAASVSLGATAQPYVALTWELLPLGA